MMAYTRRKILALFMVFAMCVSLLPVSVLAQGQYDLTLGAGDYTPEELIGIIDAAAQDGSLDGADKWKSLSADEKAQGTWSFIADAERSLLTVNESGYITIPAGTGSLSFAFGEPTADEEDGEQPGDDGATTPEGDGNTTPEGDGNTTPEGDGNTTPEGDGTTTPDGGDGTTTPEGDGNSTTTPGGGDSTTTPGGGDSTTTPGGGDSTTTPGGGDSTTTPGGQQSVTSPTSGIGMMTASLIHADPNDGDDQDEGDAGSAGSQYVSLVWRVQVVPSSWYMDMEETLQITYQDAGSFSHSVNVDADSLKDVTIEAAQLKGFNYEAKAKAGVSLADVAEETREIVLENMAKYYTMALTKESQEIMVTLTINTPASGDTPASSANVTFQVGEASLRENGSNGVLLLEMLDAATLQNNLDAALAAQGAASRVLADIVDFTVKGYMTLKRNEQKHENDDVVKVDGVDLPLVWEEEAAGGSSIEVTKTAGEYDWETRTITWTITAVPGEKTSLAGATLTDTLEHTTDEVRFDGTFAVKAASYQETDTITYENGAYSIADGVTGEPAANAAITGNELTYTFPETDADGNAVFADGEQAVITVTTKVQDGMFQDYYTQGEGTWTVTNTAVVEKKDDNGNTIQDDDADVKTIEAQFLAKTGRFPGSVSNSIDWTIDVDVIDPLGGAVIYDLLPEDVQVDAETAAAFVDDTQVELVDYTHALTVTPDSAAFLAYVCKVTSENKDDVAAMIPVDSRTSNAFPESRPETLLQEILDVKKTQYLLLIVPDHDGGAMAAGQYSFTFTTPIVVGYDSDEYKTANKAYITWIGGPGPGWFESPDIGVTYTQLAVEKTAEAHKTTKITTWTIHANNNKRPMKNVLIFDNLANVLQSSDPKRSSELVLASGGGTLELVYWTGDSRDPANAVQVREVEPWQVWDGYSEPSYWYEDQDGKQELYIYVPSMVDPADHTGESGLTYHFQFQTRGTGSYFYGYDASKNPAGFVDMTDEPANTGMGVNQHNWVSLTHNDKTVSAEASATYSNRYLSKAAEAPTGETVYDPADNTMWWKYTINEEGVKIDGAKITDQLPAGFTWTGNCVGKFWDSNQTISGDQVTDNGDGTLTIDLGSLLADGDHGIIYLETKVDMSQVADDLKTALASGKASVSFTNHAWLNGTASGEKVHAHAAGTGTIGANSVEKSGKQVTQDGYYIYEMEWTIDVNENGVANGYADPVLTDTLPEGVELQSATIYQLGTDGKVTGNDLMADFEAGGYWSYDQDTNAITFHLPNVSGEDGVYQYNAYRVTLRAALPQDLAGTEMENTAEFEAHETFTASSKNGVFYFGVSASASIYDQLPANLRYVQLIKKSAESGKALAGAVFQVEYSTDGGTTWEPYDNGNAVTTNASGQFGAPITLPAAADRIKLTETKAPGGYQMLTGGSEVIVVDLDKASLVGKNDYVTVREAEGTINDQTMEMIFVEVENEAIPNTLTLRKVSASNPNLVLEGAEFTVEACYDLDAGTWTSFGAGTYVTDANGEIVFQGLPLTLEALRLTETKAPSGYQLPTDRVTTVLFDNEDASDRSAELSQDSPAGVVLAETDDTVYTLTISNVRRGGGGGGGGGGSGDPPPTEIPDEPPPTTDIPDEDPPTTDLPDEEVPLEELPDEEVPLADVPATGDGTWLWALAAGVSGLALVWIALTGKKRGEEQDG